MIIREFKLNQGVLSRDKLGPYTQVYWTDNARSSFSGRYCRLTKRGN